MLAAMTADDVIAHLGLHPHPEGGFYRETFRDSSGPQPRGWSTAIYYLLPRGHQSRWHRVDATELWLYHAGDPLELTLAAPAGAVNHVLGTNLPAGMRPQVVVPAHTWQSARPLGEWTLVSCTVAPGFEFAGFEMAPEGIIWPLEDVR